MEISSFERARAGVLFLVREILHPLRTGRRTALTPSAAYHYASTTMQAYTNYIDGEWVPAASAGTLDVINPATREVIARVPDSGAEHVRKHAGTFAEIETTNNGKPLAEAQSDVSDAAFCFEYYGGLATKIRGDVLTIPDNAMALALREPVGVAGQIVPWNYPLMMAVQKLAPALAAGCAASSTSSTDWVRAPGRRSSRIPASTRSPSRGAARSAGSSCARRRRR